MRTVIIAGLTAVWQLKRTIIVCGFICHVPDHRSRKLVKEQLPTPFDAWLKNQGRSMEARRWTRTGVSTPPFAISPSKCGSQMGGSERTCGALYVMPAEPLLIDATKVAVLFAFGYTAIDAMST